MDKDVCMNPSIDFIGDIHGHCEELRALLFKLGYVEQAGVFRYPGDERIAVFLGDYVDRGPQVRETFQLVRAMRDAGSAVALMGNHEFNMLCFWQRNGTGGWRLKSRDAYLRDHSFNKVAIHSKTVSSFVGRQTEFKEMLDFAKTLPFYLETPEFRAQHACFDFDAVATLQNAGINSFSDGDFDKLIARANDEENEYGDSLFAPIDVMLKGPEMDMPSGMHFTDKEGVRRKKARIRWWENPEKASFQELIFQPGVQIPDMQNTDGQASGRCAEIPEWVRTRRYYGENERPVFFGHYWLTGWPKLMRDNVCCLDYSVATYRGDGLLAAYRFDGEQTLDPSKFVWVESCG